MAVCEDRLTVYKGKQAVYKGNRHFVRGGGRQTAYEKGKDGI